MELRIDAEGHHADPILGQPVEPHEVAAGGLRVRDHRARGARESRHHRRQVEAIGRKVGAGFDEEREVVHREYGGRVPQRWQQVIGGVVDIAAAQPAVPRDVGDARQRHASPPRFVPERHAPRRQRGQVGRQAGAARRVVQGDQVHVPTTRQLRGQPGAVATYPAAAVGGSGQIERDFHRRGRKLSISRWGGSSTC